MAEEICCEKKPNFGTPACIEDLGLVTRFIFVPLSVANATRNLDDLTFELVFGSLTLNTTDAWRPFPEIENFVWTPAEDKFDESANGNKSHLSNGKISIMCETWDRNATAKMIAKMKAMRCGKWGLYLVTSENKLIGSYKFSNSVDQINPIRISEQSIQALFQLKTNDATQKIMFSFDLPQNFDVSTLYSIDGDSIYSTASESISPIDFNNLPNFVDCNIRKGLDTINSVVLTINTDYRQGIRLTGINDKGDVAGLTSSNFSGFNKTSGLPIVLTVFDGDSVGNYQVNYGAPQTIGDVVMITLEPDAVIVLDDSTIIYKGDITFNVTP